MLVYRYINPVKEFLMTNKILLRPLAKTVFPVIPLLLALLATPASSAEHEMLLGSVAMDVPAEMVKRLSPLAKYLSDKTGIALKFRASPNLASAVDDLGAGQTQIAYMTPVAYLEAHEKYGVIPLVSPLTNGKDSFNLMIVVKKESPIKSVQELRGKKFALGDEKALLQRAVVVGSGIKLEELGSHAFLNHYDNIAKAVLHGDFDAGILKDSIAEKFEAQGLRVIYTSPPLSSYLFAINRKVPPEVIIKLRNAFLALKPNTPENKMILSVLDQSYTGFTPVEDKDYNTIRKLIAPFKNKK